MCAMQSVYTVEGKWPFPIDMLRRDNSQPLTDDDAKLIGRLSGEHSDDAIGFHSVQIKLGHTTDNRGYPLPNDARWRSFGWRVVGHPQIDGERSALLQARQRDADRRSGLAKLTAAERIALGLD